MTQYHVRHHYRYEYSGPIAEVRQKLIMVPPDRYGDQLVTAFHLDVRGTSGRLMVEWQSDRFGNRVCRVEAERVQSALDFDACFSLRRSTLGATPLHIDADTLELLLHFTPLTAADDRVRAAAQRIATEVEAREQQVRLAHDWAASSIAYQAGVTGTQTPAAMALHLGQGVCQDYAHIMLSVLRCLSIPARYVSGHLLGEGAPHAWVEALVVVPETGETTVMAYDPTHRRRVNSDYIVVATGRDFADVTSTSGVFRGAAVGRLHWSKHASRIPEAVDSAA